MLSGQTFFFCAWSGFLSVAANFVPKVTGKAEPSVWLSCMQGQLLSAAQRTRWTRYLHVAKEQLDGLLLVVFNHNGRLIKSDSFMHRER